MPTLIDQLADFVHAFDIDRLDPAVLDEARRCVVDTLGVVVAGQRSAVAQAALRYARQVYAPGRAAVAGSDLCLQAMGAAYVNASAGHAYDFDDTSYTGIMHGSVVVLPAALALAQELEADGSRLLEAFTVGVEVEYAVAEYCTTHLYFKGWWTTGVYGALGAAAAAARLLGLDRAGIARALALAMCHAAGIKASFGSDAKPLGVGHAASQGIGWALQAQAGLGGPADVFENQRGFLALYNDARCAADTGLAFFQRWRLVDPGILFKTYPVCSAAQAATELCARLLQAHDLDAAAVEAVRCDVPELVRISLVYDRPETIPQAQFCLPFALGCVLAFGELGLEQLTDDVLASSRLRAQMAKVSMQVPRYLADDPDVARRCPEGAGVRLVTRDGREYADFLERPTGMPGNPVSNADLAAKCRRCLAFGGFSASRAARVVDRAWQLSELPDLARLFD